VSGSMVEMKNPASFSQAKMLGVTGSILMALSLAPRIGGLLGVVGGILVLLSIKQISDNLADRSIYRNMLYAAASTIAGLSIAVVTVLWYLIGYYGQSNLFSPEFWAGFDPFKTPLEMEGFWTSILIWLVLGCVTLTISAIFARRSLSAISKKLNLSMFRVVGLVYLLGSLSTIIFIGYPIVAASVILLIVAFLSMDGNAKTTPSGSITQ